MDPKHGYSRDSNGIKKKKKTKAEKLSSKGVLPLLLLSVITF